jgi:multicomponent Na+:H+ antiporter subunit D
MLETDNALLLGVLLGGALLAAIYLLPIVYRMYFRQPVLTSEDRVSAEGREASYSMLVPLVVMSALTLVLGLAASAPAGPVSLARMAVEGFFP